VSIRTEWRLFLVVGPPIPPASEAVDGLRSSFSATFDVASEATWTIELEETTFREG
jgi:hypothetical protein